MSSAANHADLCANATHIGHDRHHASNCAECLIENGESVPKDAVTRDGWTYAEEHVRQFIGNRPGASDDPTRTKTLRDQFESAAYNRFRALKGVILTAVVDDDVFGLGGVVTNSDAVREYVASMNAQQRKLARNMDSPGPRAFDFPQDSDKVEAFREWLDSQVDSGILETVENPSLRHDSRTSEWANTYLRQSYSKGARHAEYAAREQGLDVEEKAAASLFNAPRHAETSGMIFSRAYQELDGITDAMGQAISRELADGLQQGHNSRKIARNLNGSVSDIGIHRSRVLAQTETIRAFNESALNRYEDMGVQGVTAAVELRTAQDSRVCDECRGLDSEVMTLEAARGLIPIHPRCRCTWLPNAELRTPSGDIRGAA